MARSGKVLLVCMVAVAGALPAAGTGPRELDIDKRVAAQAAIEGVYWKHRIWPADNALPKPPLNELLPEGALRGAVENYLLESKALERIWNRPIQDAELLAEIERMAASSRAPEVLQEIFTALGNDPTLVAECLARPLLADRLMREAYARDAGLHRKLKASIEESLARHPALAELRRDGEYAEAIWQHGGGRSARAGARAGERIVSMGDEMWRQSMDRLHASFPQEGLEPAEDLPVGKLSRLQEDDEHFFVQAVVEKDGARVKVATVAWRKTSFDAWWARTKAALASGTLVDAAPEATGIGSLDAEPAAAMPSLPMPAAGNCTADTWTAVQTSGAPSARDAFSAVWTGAEMIVWGGYNGTTNLDTNTGGRYTPATNSWAATPTSGAPELRDSHTGVWTGTKMVVWGGGNETFVPKNTGGRYDPATNTWAATTTTSAAAARLYHTAVWTGTKMVVWGGWNGSNRDLDTGGLYDPAADSWVATSRTGGPTVRDQHSAVWTGTTMIVWGGEDDNAVAQGDGGRFNPAANTWSAPSITGGPAGRWMHSAVWTGSKMIVWGGYDGVANVSTGGVYDPAANTWTLTSDVGAPAPRAFHVGVWADTTSEMIVWGGQDDFPHPLISGGRYNPATGLWTPTSTAGAPASGRYNAAIWTGSEMIVWGGWNTGNPGMDLNTGGRYCDVACASPPPPGTAAVSVNSQPGGELVSWTAVSGADSYDLVRGSLTLLQSSGGNFTTATQACVANNQAGLSLLDSTLPPVGSGFWYLVRGVSCGGPGTYDSADGSQVGSRDVEINASANSCP